jgi:gamma-glutamyltranspeptidase/glutathione hydrolase
MKGMVVAPHSLAVEEGVKALRKGGNAVDAALTTAFVQSVVGMDMGGFAGFGSMQIYMADSGVNKIIDFHGKAGSKALPDIWKDLFVTENRSGYGITLKGLVNNVGYKSITVSGNIRAYHEALTRYGTMSWRKIIDPAIPYAEKGYPVSGEQARRWRTPESWMQRSSTATKACEDIFLKRGEPYGAGEILIQTDKGKTLRVIAEEGPDVFYTGEIGEKIARDLEENDSLIVGKDWKTPKVKISDPLSTDYRGYKVTTNTAPGGGLTLIQELRAHNSHV